MPPTPLIAAAAAALATLASLAPAAADPPTLEQFFRIRAPSRVTLAPDGALYAVDWPDGINQLYRRAAGAPPGATMARLTDFPDGISGYTLSPDGGTLLVEAAAGGSEQRDIHRLDPATGAISPLFVDPRIVYRHQHWLTDGSAFFYTANDESPADFYIYRYDLASAESTRLLARPGNWYVADATPDGSRLLVGQFRSASDADVFELDAATGELRSLGLAPADPAGATAANFPVAYAPGHGTVVIRSDAEEGVSRLFARDLSSGKVRAPVPEMSRWDVDSAAVNEDNSLLAVVYNEHGYGTLRVFSLPGFEPVQVPAIERGLVTSVQVRGRTVTFTLSNTRTPNLSYAFAAGKDGDLRPLTEADTQGVDTAAFPLPDLVTYRSFDGLEVPAFLYIPPGRADGTPIPFVVMFHGGPEGQHRPGFSRLNQFLLSRGFGVMEPNVRGSTGYGRAYHMLDDYTKRWDSVRDGTEAARWLVARGHAEPGRIAAWGGSYGGFMAVAAVIEGGSGDGPNPFGASVNSVGIVNFITFLEQTKDYRRRIREAEYGPLDDREFLASISPINRIAEIDVPMLISHGLNDPRVPIGEAMQLAVGLQKRGHDPEILFFPDEGHGLAKLENRLLFYRRAAAFLDRTIAR